MISEIKLEVILRDELRSVFDDELDSDSYNLELWVEIYNELYDDLRSELFLGLNRELRIELKNHVVL